MSAIPSAETVMSRLKMALAEAGYPDVTMSHCGFYDDGYPIIESGLLTLRTVPDAVRWMAARIAYGGRVSCWACWNDPDAMNCDEGDCAHPEGPARPPRELLRSAS